MATDKVAVTTWIEPEIREAIRREAYEQRKSISAIVGECLNEKFGSPPEEPALKSEPPAPTPPRQPFARQQFPSIPANVMAGLAQLGWGPNDLGSLSPAEAVHIVSKQIKRT